MPFCARCGRRIQYGRLCAPCERDDLRSREMGSEQSTPDWVDCDNCRGRGWVWDGESKVDCPVCEGFGRVEVVADGGFDLDRSIDEASLKLERAIQPHNPYREEQIREALQLLEGVREEVTVDE